MKKLILMSLSVLVVLQAGPVVTQVRASQLLGNSFYGQIYDVDPLTGTLSNPRASGISSLSGISFSPDGILYGITASFSSNSALFSIDPISGQSLMIGLTGLEYVTEGDLDFDPTTGELYGMYGGSIPAQRLFKINTSTGVASIVGMLPFFPLVDPSAMAFDDGGNLYLFDNSSEVLVKIDKNNGALLSSISVTPPLPSQTLAGMDFDPSTGTLYVATGMAAGGANALYTLDTDTGVLTQIGPIAGGLSGLEFVPDPGCKIQVYKDDIKWSQPPVEVKDGIINGWDERSDYNNSPIVADDWICGDNRPIKDIHWWGSFKGWTECVPPDDAPSAFHIGIWTDVPDPNVNDSDTFSHPDKLIWEKISDCAVWSCAGYDLDPRGIDSNDLCFKFDQLLSQDEWFTQESNDSSGTVYWLSISAIYDVNNIEHPWGWKTRPHFFNDDAVRIGQCPSDCTSPDFDQLQAGIADNFTLPTELALPGTKMDNAYPGVSWRDFDEVVSNTRFGHTFTDLPSCIIAAELEIHLKAGAGGSSNDAFYLDWNGTPSFVWGSYIRDIPLLPGGSPIGSWSSAIPDEGTFILDLDNLEPTALGVTSILSALQDGDLDVYVQDDTIVDYVILRVWYCPKSAWPPQIDSAWTGGEPIEYPQGTSWDMAFVLTANRQYTPRKWHWSDDDSAAMDLYPDGIINLVDFAIFASYWLDKAIILYP